MREATAGNRGRWVAGAAALGLAVTTARAAIRNPITGSTEGGNTGFLVRKQPAAITDAIDDFERYRDHQAWEKAFAALAKVGEAAGDRLVATADGVAIPAPLKVRRELLSLPPDGRQAYRLFNDAKAKQLLAKATGAADDVTVLRQVVDGYFVTSVGDVAADRLGDALFEAGDFAGAEACWRMVVDEFPDPTVSLAQLQAKRATALAAAGQAGAYDMVRADVDRRYAATPVRIGGRDVPAGAYVGGLAGRAHHADAPAKTTADGGPIAMPAADAPAWQVPLMGDEVAKAIESRMANFGWGRQAGSVLSSVPAVAADDRRAYVNWYGATFAVDLATGKLLWRTVSPSKVGDTLVTTLGTGNMPNPGGFTLTLVGNRLLTTGRPATGDNNQSAVATLACLSADIGHVEWSTLEGPLKGWNLVGPPLVDATGGGVGSGGGVVHCVAMEPGDGNGGKQDYWLVTLALADGAVRSKVPLGQPQFPSDNYRGNPSVRPPALAVRGGRVLVLVNDGALLSVDPANQKLEWAYSFPAVAAGPEQYYGYAVHAPPTAPAAVLVSGSTAYVKDYGATALYALDVGGAVPTLKWQRPVDADAGLVSLAGDRLLTSGDSVDAIDVGAAAEQPMRWSAAVAAGTGDARPLAAGNHLYVFGRRGVQDISRADGTDAGPIFRGADRDTDGGPVLVAGGKLLTVSGRAVSAYPLARTPGGH